MWKKLKLIAATAAAVKPARRPPNTAAATTNTTRISATLVLPIVSRTATSRPATKMITTAAAQHQPMLSERSRVM